MKRIIDGATYNTDTATRVAEGTYEDEQRGVTSETSLYQNKAGVFFSVEEIETTYYDRNREEERTRETTEWEVVGDASKATAYCERLGLNILRDFTDFPPEAEVGETTAPIYMRAPPSLKAALEAKAAQENVSLNVLMLRCAEQCLGQR